LKQKQLSQMPIVMMMKILNIILVILACNSGNSALMSNKFKHIAKFGAKLSIATGLLGAPQFVVPPAAFADARLNAPTAAGTRVNSDAGSLLRYGLPFQNKDVRDVQASIESARMNLKTRRPGFAKADLDNAKKIMKTSKAKMLKAVPGENKVKAEAAFQKLSDAFDPLYDAINEQMAAGTGSIQERQGLDNAFEKQEALANQLSTFEDCFISTSFKRVIPEEYKDLPVLQGRATVEMVVVKPDGSKYDVDGVLYDQVTLTMVIDGYNAPLTGGNFVDLVNKGYYNKKRITRSDGFVVQTGDNNPDGDVHGYIPPGFTEERKIPLEIALRGEEELLYGETSEDYGKGYAAAVLPFQSYGALGMARSEFEADSASTQFFWLLFESDLTPAGKNMLDGRYTNFGYTVKNAELLKGVQEGDVIKYAKVIDGFDKLSPP